MSRSAVLMGEHATGERSGWDAVPFGDLSGDVPGDLAAAPASAGHRHLGPAARLAIAAIRLYQRLRTGRPSPCRFTPTCSAYAVEAVEVHGLWRGTGLAARRIGRCHPWGPTGDDPVPPPGSRRSLRSDGC